MRANFEGHRGWLFPTTGQVQFYGVGFMSISQAIKDLLRHLEPSDRYRPWCYKNYRGLRDEDTLEVYIDHHWHEDARCAKLYVDNILNN